MELLTAEQMRAADRHAIERLGIPGIQLMENAGASVFGALTRAFPAVPETPVSVFCGKGNNGGDGFVVARRLVESGRRVRTALVGAAPDGLHGDAALACRRAREAGVVVTPLSDAAAIGSWVDDCGPGPVVDALLGTGATGAARGAVGTAIEALETRGPGARGVLAVDLPSGLNANDGSAAGPVIHAGHTVTLCRPKLGLYLGRGPDCCGRVEIGPIGIPNEAIADLRATWTLLDAAWVRERFPARRRDAHKGSQGRLLLVAGGPGMVGAAILAARAAVRGGAGLVRAVLDDGLDAFHAAVPEAVRHATSGEPPRIALDAVDAAVAGPGTVHADGADAWLDALLAHPVPAVIDADAWNRTAGSESRRAALRDRPGTTVCTPHPGEAARFLGATPAEVQRDRPAALDALVEATGAVVVLKGAHTLVGAPDGRRALCDAGNPGMATAGSGDVLAGWIGALLARGTPAFDAAAMAVRLHARCGDRTAATRGTIEGISASDLVEAMPRTVGDELSEDVP